MVFLQCARIAISVLLGLALTVVAKGPLPNQIKNLVTFGDSYTDIVSIPN